MTKLKSGDKVKVHYVGTLKDGSEFDNSRERKQTLEFAIDDGKLLKGFNDAVKDLGVGEKTKVKLEAKEAYGEYNVPPLTFIIDKNVELGVYDEEITNLYNHKSILEDLCMQTVLLPQPYLTEFAIHLLCPMKLLAV